MEVGTIVFLPRSKEAASAFQKIFDYIRGQRDRLNCRAVDEPQLVQFQATIGGQTKLAVTDQLRKIAALISNRDPA